MPRAQTSPQLLQLQLLLLGPGEEGAGITPGGWEWGLGKQPLVHWIRAENETSEAMFSHRRALDSWENSYRSSDAFLCNFHAFFQFQVLHPCPMQWFLHVMVIGSQRNRLPMQQWTITDSQQVLDLAQHG